jgi:hypothetical protein
MHIKELIDMYYDIKLRAYFVDVRRSTLIFKL